jgi:hypothetical protein
MLIERYGQLHGSPSQQTNFVACIEHWVNSEVLGEPWRLSHWRLPMKKNSDNSIAIGEVTMPNQHARKFIDAFEDLVDICVPDDDVRNADWKDAAVKWRNLIHVARQKEDFTDEQIDELDKLCDDFFEAWLLLHGRNGLTNYIHLIGSGHLCYYVRKWRNLYKYSQQGWESLNSLIKRVFYTRTQRGGHGGKDDEANSKVVPLGRWLQRKLFFLSGEYKKLEFKKPTK